MDFNLLISFQAHQSATTYALWEWLRALDRPPLEQRILTNVTRPGGVLQAMHTLADALEANWADMSRPASEALARVRANREAWCVEQDEVGRRHNGRPGPRHATRDF